MRVASETELKLEMEAARHARVLALLAPGVKPQRETLTTIYFDTPDGRLAREGFVVRVRTQKSGVIQSVKGPDSGGGLALKRAEHENALSLPRPDLSLLPASLRRKLTALIGRKPLKPRFTIALDRTSVQVDTATGPIALCADDGVIHVPGLRRKGVIAEIELESKGASPGSLYDVAQAIVAEGGACLSTISKAERAALFAARADTSPARRAGLPPLERKMNAASAFAGIFGACLVQIAGNVPAIIHANSPDGVHQMRVGLRRLRAALAISGLPKADAEFEALREEAGAIASSLGAARDLDVFSSGLLALARKHEDALGGTGALLPLATRIEHDRSKAWARAIERVGAATTQQFLLHASQLIEARLSGITAMPPPALLVKVREFAARALSRAMRRVEKQGRGFPHQSPEDIHRLRLAIKRLRYAAEFFAPLFDPSSARAKPFLKSLSRLQDQFGHINDAATALTILGNIRADEEASHLHAATLFVAGVAKSEAAWATRQAARLFDAFLELKPFWPAVK